MSTADVSAPEAAALAQLRALLAVDTEQPGVWYGSEWTSWGQLGRCAAAIDAALTGLGIGPRARVLLVLRNRPSAVAAFLGTLAYRRVPVLASHLLPAPQLRAAASAAGVGAVVLDEEDHALGQDRELAAAGLPTVLLPVGTGAAVTSVRTVQPPEGGGPELVSAGRGYEMDPTVAVLVSTSGTTGAAKHVPLRWSQLPFDPTGIRPARHPDQRAPVIHTLSMATITGTRGLMRAAAAGRAVALLERLDLEQWLSLVERFRVRRAGLPPAAMRMLLDQQVPRERLSGLEAWLTGSAPLDPGLQREFEDHFGIPVLVAYGSTELGGTVTSWTLELHRQWRDRKLGSVGRALPGVELRIVDEQSGEPVPTGHPGLITARVPNAPQDGWIRTADRGYLDEDGFLWVLGRADDVINRGGFKVSLGELEQLFREHPAVREVVAVALPDPRVGQLPAVGIQLRRGMSASEEELRQWAIERTARYKVPRIAILDRLPMGPSHKGNRAELAELLNHRFAAEPAGGAE